MAKIEMPSSSINSTGESPKKQLKKVTTGKVTIKQESEIQKLAHNFLAEDLQTIREKLWTDYILPGIKNMVCSAVNIALFGVDRSRTNTNGYSQQRNSYSSYYANANQSRPPQNNYRPNRLDWQNITFDSYADANDVFHAVEAEQLVGVDADGGHSHTAAHHADGTAFVGAGKAQHPAHAGHLPDILQKGVGNKLGTQGVTRHKDCLGEIAHFCADVRGRHR